jgi:hypothetical protein
VTVKLRATVSARDARRFRAVPAARKTVTIGSSTRLAGSGRTGLRLKLSRKLRAPRRKAALPVTVKMTLIGASGLSRTYTVHAVLRRG